METLKEMKINLQRNKESVSYSWFANSPSSGRLGMGRAVRRKSKRCIYFKGDSAEQLFLHLISLPIVLDTDQNGKRFWFCFGMIKGEKVE